MACCERALYLRGFGVESGLVELRFNVYRCSDNDYAVRDRYKLGDEIECAR